MAGDYDPAFFADLARMQDRHFCIRGRNRLIAHLVQQESGRNAGRFRFLDAGCGTGGVLKYLERNETGAHLVGMDLFPEALEYARAQVGSPLVRGSVAHVPFDASINAVGAFDVIGHLDDAVDALRSMHQATVAGGRMLVTTPANPALWSFFDEAAGHKRRYTKATLIGTLEAAGYRVERVGYFMAVLAPLTWLRRRLLRQRSLDTANTGTVAHDNSGGNNPAAPAALANPDEVRDAVRAELRIVPVVNEIFAALLAIEAWLLALGIPLPRAPFRAIIERLPRLCSGSTTCAIAIASSSPSRPYPTTSRRRSRTGSRGWRASSTASRRRSARSASTSSGRGSRPRRGALQASSGLGIRWTVTVIGHAQLGSSEIALYCTRVSVLPANRHRTETRGVSDRPSRPATRSPAAGHRLWHW